jgi:hypothetical protein
MTKNAHNPLKSGVSPHWLEILEELQEKAKEEATGAGTPAAGRKL